MREITDLIINGFIWVINYSYVITRDYWIAIFVFTLLTKIILLPLSIWVQKNSIKTVRMQPKLNYIKATYCGNSDLIAEEQYKLFKSEKYSPFIDLIPLFVQIMLLMVVVEAVKKGTLLTDIPIYTKGWTLIVPILAAFSAFLMCYVQNKSNVLQSEQGRLNKYGTMIFSILLSLYLGLFVSIGVGAYWIYSNILSIIQLFLLNRWYNPKKYINYEELEKSKKELAKVKEFMDSKGKESRNDPYRKRSKEDYKRFLKIRDKKIVFYSEKNGFYKYYKDIIEEIIKRTNIVVYYITGDPNDKVFEMKSEQFLPFYIGENRLIVLMMKMETDIFVMTTPDLNNFHLKRSYVKKDIEYVYIPHDVNSANMSFRKNALDYYDTIFSSGIKNTAEILEREKIYNLNKKKIVEWGSSVIDDMTIEYEKNIEKGQNRNKKSILIAPSWQKDNIMDTHIEEILNRLKDLNYQIIVRPHPQYVKHCELKIDSLINKYKNFDIIFEKDFSSNKTVFMADLLITDWSSIAYEYAFSTLKPVLFINTPMKILNPDYQEISTVPIDIELRNKVGISLEENELKYIVESIKDLLERNEFSRENLQELKEKYIYNNGKSGKVGAKYLIQQLINKSNT